MDFVIFSTSAFAPACAEASRKPTSPRPKTPPQNVRKYINFYIFLVPGGAPRNEASKMLSGRLSGRLRGAPGSPPDQLSAPRGPQEAPHDFFLASGPPPGRRQERFEALPAATLRGSQNPSGPSFWTLRPPSPGAFSVHFLRFSASFFEALSLPWVVLFRVRVRLRSMFWGLRRLNFASLKASMPESLGGRNT